MRLLPNDLTAAGAAAAQPPRADTIPLPEHPRPDFERADVAEPEWAVALSRSTRATRASGRLADGARPARAPRSSCPFSWGAPLSGVRDSADIGVVRADDHGARRRGAAGASSSSSARPTGARRAWLDGEKLGEHQGGYTPFSFELTARSRCGRSAAPRRPRRRHAAPVQARGKAGLRQGARHVADGLPRGARRRRRSTACTSRRTPTLDGVARRRAAARAGAARPDARV